MRTDPVASEVFVLLWWAGIHSTAVVLGTMPDQYCGIDKARVSEGTEGMQGVSQIGHDAGGVAERRPVDGVVAQAEMVDSFRQVEEGARQGFRRWAVWAVHALVAGARALEHNGRYMEVLGSLE